MTYEEYEQLPKEQKLKEISRTKDEEFIHYAFYDDDIDINLELCQNELLPLGKLKKYSNSKDLYLKQKAIVVYERRLIY